jgi:ABC-type branched-subunit amino acid transport system substrate-binding protein/predicted negative regulator of RcsB-dependent stress response
MFSHTINPKQSSASRRMLGVVLLAGLLLTVPGLGTAANNPPPNNPSSLPTALRQAKQLLEKGDPEAAATALQQFLAASPRADYLDDAYLLLGAAYYDAKNFPDALKYLNLLHQQFPESEVHERGQLLLARTHAAMGNPDLALPLLAQVRTLTQDEGTKREAMKLTADVFIQKRDFVRAIRTLLDGLEGSSDQEAANLREQVRTLLTEQLDRKGLLRVRQSFPRVYPGDLASIRLINDYIAHGEDHLAERESRHFLAAFPDHPQASTVRDSLAQVSARLRANQYLVAAVLPLSGNLSPFANEVLEGIQLALDQAKTQGDLPSIGLLVKDQDADRQGFLDDLSTLLVYDRPLAVIGPLLSKNLPAMAEMAQRHRVPLITPAATLPNVRRLSSYLFSTALTYQMQAERIAAYAVKDQGYRRFCVFHPDTVYGRELARLFVQEVRRYDGEIIAVRSYKEGDTDFGPQITALKEEDLKKYGLALPIDVSQPGGKSANRNSKRLLYTPGFDAIFIPSRSSDVGLIAAQLAFHDIHVPLLGANGWNSPDFVRAADRAVEGAVFVDGFFADSLHPSVKDFVERYQKRTQTLPSLFVAQGYDAARVVIEGIRHGATSGESLRDFLTTQRSLPTLTGPAGFGPDGALHRPLFLLQVKQGKFVQIE